MPPWAQFAVGAAAFVGAVVYLWKTVLSPANDGITTMKQLLPLARELVEQFHDQPEALETLRDIAMQFRANSGTSLRDVINRLERAAGETTSIIKMIEVDMETTRRLAEKDRAQLAELIAKLDRANAGITAAATGAESIAGDLAAAHARAEEHDPTDAPGAASDSAMRRPETP